MRIAMVGTGSWARRGPLPAISLLKDVELVAAYDTAPGSAESAMECWGGKSGVVCGSLDELLKMGNVDAVMVVTPPAHHAEIVNKVLDARKPVICEKPVCLSSHEVTALCIKADALGIPNAVDHEYRYDQGMKTMAGLLRSGYVGAVRTSSLSAVANFANDPRFESVRYWNFHHSATLGGGMLPQFASHYLDLHHFMFSGLEAMGGYLPARVAARPTRPNTPGGPDGPLKPVEAEDTAALAGILPDGGAASLSLSFVARALPDLRWAVHGDDGTLVYEGSNGWFGGRLYGARGMEGKREEFAIPARNPDYAASGLSGWFHENIAALLTDFAAVVGGSSMEGQYSTFAQEQAVWRAIENWRQGQWD